MQQQPFARVLHQIDDIIESLLSPVIRIGDMGGLAVLAEFDEKADFAPAQALSVEAVEIGEVFLVGDEEQVEIIQIVGTDLARFAGDGVAAGYQGGGHARVRALASVVADGPGGIDVDRVGEFGVLDELAEDDLRGGGTADVSHADEEDAEGLAVGGHRVEKQGIMLRVSTLAAIANLFLIVLAAARPNVIVVITDDQGYGDLSAHGNPGLKTPALDAFRKQSTAFERFQVSPTCAPTRAALMTGLHEFRCGVSHTLMGRSLLRPGIPTLPEMFRAAGYRTGIFGKWHLGDAYPCRPEDRGFEDVFVHGGGGIGQTPDFWGNSYFDPMIRRNSGWEKTRGYCTDVFFQEAIGWMKARVAEKKPFFLHLATNAPHAPYVPPVKDATLDESAAFSAMIGNIDTNFGRLMEALVESGAAKDTIVVFLTDNGSALARHDAGMKGKKGTPDEGGTRVPCFIRWPEKIAAGREVGELAAHLDLLPTLTSLCAVPRPEGWRGDGRDLSAALLGKESFPEDRVLFTQVGRWPGDAAAARFRARDFAVRDQRWRLVGLELFDMLADPGQEKNVFGEHPEEARRLLAEYGKWWEEVLPSVREPVRYVIGSKACPVVKLTAHDWWPSKETEAEGAEKCVTHGAIRDFLKDAQVAATRNALPSRSGHWKLEAAHAGNYELVFGLLPPEAPAEDRRDLAQLRAGVAHVRAGQEETRVEIRPGATSFQLPIDLDAGPLDLEIWFDGQLLNDRILGAFFASIERKGERKIEIPKFKVKPVR